MKIALGFVVSFFFCGLNQTWAQNHSSSFIMDTSRSEKYLFIQLQKHVAECVEKNATSVSEDGKSIGFRVKCQDVRLLSANQMLVKYGGQIYSIILSESAESDGGDLNDLRIYDSRSNLVVSKDNVLAFNNVVAALVGFRNER